MRQTVYLETTIFSFLTARPSRSVLSAAWQTLTVEWWETRRGAFDLFISELVREEAGRGDVDAAARRAAAMNDIPLLAMTPDVTSVASKLVESELIPSTVSDDAVHLALCSVHSIDYLLTWNCRHLDNASVKPRVRALLLSLGLHVPEICTPQELLGD